MKKTAAVLAAAGILTLYTAVAPANAAEGSADASVGVFSKYVWRGMTFSEKAVVQPTVGLSYGGFSANLWANYDTDLETPNETDVTVSYGRSTGKLSYEAGAIYYGLEGVDDTTELYLSVGYDVILSPSATLYWDVDAGDGGFLVLAAGYSIPATLNR